MGRMVIFLIGVIAGVVMAQQFSRTPQGRRVLAAVGETTGEFAQAVADSYRARRAEIG